MIGAIIGDLIGSVYEYRGLKTKDFPLFCVESDITDDSILTFAVFEALEKCSGDYDDLGRKVITEFARYYAIYPNPVGGYGGSFLGGSIRFTVPRKFNLHTAVTVTAPQCASVPLRILQET